MTRRSLERWLQREWQKNSAWQLVLWPLSQIFKTVVHVRRLGYQFGLLPSYKLPVPVIVVGNITVGGTGKTPLTLWVVRLLREQRLSPGIISRGYLGKHLAPQQVHAGSDPDQVGDEPLLMAKTSRCPVWVGKDRVAAAQALLRHYPQCNVLVCDDGLQHYRLRRDMEVAVVDGERLFGNRRLLPAGYLREPISRLASLDAIVVNGGITPHPDQYQMSLVGDIFFNLAQPERCENAAAFRGKKICALAGIGNPNRFFVQLRNMGLQFSEHAYPDHHHYRPEDLPRDAEVVLMTEKDAVKCFAFANEKCWFLKVEARVDASFGVKLLQIIRNYHGSQTA